MKRLLIIVCAIPVISLMSCDKTAHVSGVVVSKHDIPLPGYQVSFVKGSDGHLSGSGGDVVTTDAHGRFNYKGTLCNHCWIVSIECSGKDSGASSNRMDVGFTDADNLVLKINSPWP